MLNEKSFTLLEYFNNQSEKGVYKVYEFSEIINEFSYLTLDEKELTRIIHLLSAGEYVALKYIDEKEVCLSILTKGAFAVETRQDFSKTFNEKKVFLYSFLGGVSGAIIMIALWLVFWLLGAG